jgi:hypothetical protein
MKYLILKTPSIEYAKAISRFIYSMSNPNESNDTTIYCPCISHPITKQVALVFPDEDTLPIKAGANPKLLVDTIRFAITADEAIALENTINGGGIVNPIEHIPSSLNRGIKTYEELKEDGWFPSLFNY